MNANARKTHCPAGHPYDEANTRRVAYRSGHLRICRTCARERARRVRSDPARRDREQYLSRCKRAGVTPLPIGAP